MKPFLPFVFCLFWFSAFSQKDALAKRYLQDVRTNCLLRINDTPSPKPPIASGCVVFQKDTTPKTAIRLRCYATITKDNEPLVVLDGVPLEDGQLSSVNPNAIESITVLKAASAQALYGYRAAAGVIIITTKKLKDCGLLVLDEQDKASVNSANITMHYGTNSVWTTSYSKDTVRLSKCSKGQSYRFTVTRVGYQPLETTLRFDSAGQVYTVYLKRAYKAMDDVVIIGYDKRWIRCGLCGGTFTRLHPHYLCNKPEAKSSPSVWPNPAMAGQRLTVMPPEDFTGHYQVLSPTGQILRQGNSLPAKGNSFQLTTGNWPAGIYFLRCSTGEATGKAVTQKFIIQ